MNHRGGFRVFNPPRITRSWLDMYNPINPTPPSDRQPPTLLASLVEQSQRRTRSEGAWRGR